MPYGCDVELRFSFSLAINKNIMAAIPLSLKKEKEKKEIKKITIYERPSSNSNSRCTVQSCRLAMPKCVRMTSTTFFLDLVPHCVRLPGCGDSIFPAAGVQLKGKSSR